MEQTISTPTKIMAACCFIVWLCEEWHDVGALASEEILETILSGNLLRRNWQRYNIVPWLHQIVLFLWLRDQRHNFFGFLVNHNLKWAF
jgi:hypothetical protein